MDFADNGCAVPNFDEESSAFDRAIEYFELDLSRRMLIPDT